MTPFGLLVGLAGRKIERTARGSYSIIPVAWPNSGDLPSRFERSALQGLNAALPIGCCKRCGFDRAQADSAGGTGGRTSGLVGKCPFPGCQTCPQEECPP